MISELCLIRISNILTEIHCFFISLIGKARLRKISRFRTSCWSDFTLIILPPESWDPAFQHIVDKTGGQEQYFYMYIYNALEKIAHMTVIRVISWGYDYVKKKSWP